MMLKTVALFVVLPLLGVALVLAFVRLARGPSLPDRVVALDLMTALVLGMIAAYGIGAGQPVFLDVAIVLALVSFVATIAFAAYVDDARRGDDCISVSDWAGCRASHRTRRVFSRRAVVAGNRAR